MHVASTSALLERDKNVSQQSCNTERQLANALMRLPPVHWQNALGQLHSHPIVSFAVSNCSIPSDAGNRRLGISVRAEWGVVGMQVKGLSCIYCQIFIICLIT